MIARSPASGSWHTTTCSCSWKSCTRREYNQAPGGDRPPSVGLAGGTGQAVAGYLIANLYVIQVPSLSGIL
jgi:hypothetical protein